MCFFLGVGKRSSDILIELDLALNKLLVGVVAKEDGEIL
jgi:hypothetical protein